MRTPGHAPHTAPSLPPPQGVHGQTLHVDLGAGTAQAQALPPQVQTACIGGVGLGTWLLLQAAPVHYAALAPEAPLVLAFAPLTGTALNTSAKAAVLCKSPLTGRINDALISSRIALAGRGTGHEALVLRGRCADWSVLFVDEGGMHLAPAAHLLGGSAQETEARLREAHGEDWCVLAVGVAGEHEVPFATVSHDGRHAGRGGTGAVLGSKRLKAIALRGRHWPAPAHPQQVQALRETLRRASQGPGTEKYRSTGTLGNLAVFDRLGILPTDNFRAGGDARAEGLSVERLQGSGALLRATCADCTIGCEKRVRHPSGGSTRLEYENVYALGALNGVWEMPPVLEASRLCDELGLDTISLGATLAFARECAQVGLLDEPALLDDPAALLGEAVRRTATREGWGALLALGSRALAQRLGGGALELAPQVKGLELPGYHPGGLQSLALGLAVGARGADHNKSGAYDLDLSGDVDRFTLDAERIAEMVALEDQAALMDSLILCKFVRRALGDLFEDGARMLSAVTGHPFRAEDLRRSAAHIQDLKKLFNQRQGWTAAEDVLPARFMAPEDALPPVAGAAQPPRIVPGPFLAARRAYYRARGWDDAGRLPATRGTAQAILDLPE